MIVRCIENRLNKVKNAKTSDLLFRNYNYSDGEGKDDVLEIGQYYVVYSLFEGADFKWYFTRFWSDRPYALWHPEFFFEVIDPRPSKYWMKDWNYRLECSGGIGTLYAFPEYAEREDLYVNLVDRSTEELEIFENCAKKIREEAVL
jgi:hypothetical protein